MNQLRLTRRGRAALAVGALLTGVLTAGWNFPSVHADPLGRSGPTPSSTGQGHSLPLWAWAVIGVSVLWFALAFLMMALIIVGARNDQDVTR